MLSCEVCLLKVVRNCLKSEKTKNWIKTSLLRSLSGHPGCSQQLNGSLPSSFQSRLWCCQNHWSTLHPFPVHQQLNAWRRHLISGPLAPTMNVIGNEASIQKLDVMLFKRLSRYRASAINTEDVRTRKD